MKHRQPVQTGAGMKLADVPLHQLAQRCGVVNAEVQPEALGLCLT